MLVGQPLLVWSRTILLSSDHLACLPRGWSSSTIPSINVLSSLSSFILQISPNSFNFLCFIMSAVVQCLCTFCLIITLLITLSFQHAKNVRSFFGVVYLYWLCFSSIKQTRKHMWNQNIKFGLLLDSIFNIPIPNPPGGFFDLSLHYNRLLSLSDFQRFWFKVRFCM